MEIHSHTGGPVATNGYIVADQRTGHAAIIDAPHGVAAPLLAIAARRKWTVKYLLLTHGHWDHTADHQLITDAFPAARVLIHRLDEPKLTQPGSAMFPIPFVIPSRKADAYLEDNAEVSLGDGKLVVMFTPGHAPGHVCLYSAADSVLFAGDLLFAQSIGRTDLPDSNPRDMQTSLQRVMHLPDETLVYSGHGPSTTIGRERQINPWLQSR